MPVDTTYETHASQRTAIAPSVRLGATAYYYFALLTVIIARLWILPLRGGFWLDETGTVWAIQGTLRDVISRCSIWPAQSPAYSVIAWLFFHIGGPHELLLRLPSFAAMVLSLYLLYRLAIRLIGPEAAWLSAIVFASFEAVAYAAGDARPYALAMLGVISSTLLLVRWLDTGHRIDLLGYCVLASLGVYMHSLFATILVVHLAYGVFRVRTEKRISAGQLSVAATLVGLLLLPLTFYMAAVWKTAHSHSFSGTPTITDFFAFLAPPVLIGIILAVVVVAQFTKQHVKFYPAALSNSSLMLVAAWTLIPVGLLFVVSVLTNLKVFLPRYILPSEAGLALVGGWLLSSINPSRIRMLAVTGIAFTSLLSAPSAQFAHGGDWRAAMAAVRSVGGGSNIPVLIRSDFPESEPFDWLKDQTRSSYLFAPLTAYPIGNNVLRLPMYLNPASIAYLNELVPNLEHSPGFLFVNMGDASYSHWLSGRLSTQGFVVRRVGHFGGTLTVDMYVPSSTTNHANNQ